jgi:protoporphyrinogen oxidase
MKIAVIGTGISGLSVARMLQSDHEVVLFEKATRIGGLIKCERIRDNLFHRVGGHVFNSRNQQVLDWFWSHFDRENEFVKARRKAKVYFDDRIVGYPIENYLYLLDSSIVQKVVSELLVLQKSPHRSPFEYENFEKFLQHNFGHTLYNIYFKPYNQKIWQVDLSQVSMDWLEGKLPMPNLGDMILSNILREEENNMVHASFYYARENGSQFIVDRLAKGLDIRTDTLVKEVQFKDKKYTIAGETGFDKVIYCGDIRQLPGYWKNSLVENGVDTEYLSQLRSNGTSNLFCETDDTDISWLYIPQPFTRAHRIIYTGNFSESNNRGSARKTCVVEFSGQVAYETMVEEIKKLPGNLSPLDYNYEPNSYVIQDHRTRPEIKKAKDVLEKQNMYLLGRFAEWEYYNMDKCIEAAFGLVSKLNPNV